MFQDEEFEALSSIYGIDFHMESQENRTCIIDIKEGDLESHLQIRMESGYPSNGPPTYTLSAPWLKGQNRQKLCAYLNDIYL